MKAKTNNETKTERRKGKEWLSKEIRKKVNVEKFSSINAIQKKREESKNRNGCWNASGRDRWAEIKGKEKGLK